MKMEHTVKIIEGDPDKLAVLENAENKIIGYFDRDGVGHKAFDGLYLRDGVISTSFIAFCSELTRLREQVRVLRKEILHKKAFAAGDVIFIQDMDDLLKIIGEEK